jgi:uncharacterized protein RhaS with RHS repeats
MYDPTVGRWSTQDPLLFQAGDPNLYRYVQNHPTDATDPSGLDELQIQSLKHRTIELPDGPKGTIAVWTDVKHKGDSKWIKIMVQTRPLGNNDDLNWLQTAWRYEKKGDKYLPGIYHSPSTGKYYHFANSGTDTHWNVDTDSETNPYYRVEYKPTTSYVAIWDEPSDDHAEEATETGTVADSYLVDDSTGKLLYHVHWERISTKGKDGQWTDEYTYIWGNVPKGIPPDLKPKNLPGGWSSEEDASNPNVKPTMYPNPIKKT